MRINDTFAINTFFGQPSSVRTSIDLIEVLFFDPRHFSGFFLWFLPKRNRNSLPSPLSENLPDSCTFSKRLSG